VSIHQKDFDLAQMDQQADFLRETFNLAAQVDMLSAELDQDKEGSLTKIDAAARPIMSLSKDGARTIGDANDVTMHSLTEGFTEDEHDPAIFGADDIQNILRKMKFRIELIPWGVRVLAVCGRFVLTLAPASSPCLHRERGWGSARNAQVCPARGG